MISTLIHLNIRFESLSINIQLYFFIPDLFLNWKFGKGSLGQMKDQ